MGEVDNIERTIKGQSVLSKAALKILGTPDIKKKMLY